jgi:hypothetical protein
LILTAPPKVTDADYQKLKKLATRTNVGEKFEKALDEKRTEEIFSRINATPAYYHHKEWEEDYRVQKAGQKFMRQVRYKRPKGFIDPFAPVARVEDDDDDLDDIDLEELVKEDGDRNATPGAGAGARARASTGRGSRGAGSKGSKTGFSGLSSSKSSGHVNNMRGLRENKSNNAHSGPQTGPEDTDARRSKTSPSKLQRGGSKKASIAQAQQSQYGRGDTGGANDQGSELGGRAKTYEEEPVNKDAPLLLAHVHRHTPLQDGRQGVDQKLPSLDILADIQCWRKIVQSDEIKPVVQVSMDYDLDDNDSIGSGGFANPGGGKQELERKREPRRAVGIVAIRAEILDFSERMSTILLSVDRLLASWQTYCVGKDPALPIRPMRNMDTGDIHGAGTRAGGGSTISEADEEILKVIAREIAAGSSLIIELDPKQPFSDETILRIVLPPLFASAEVRKREPKKGASGESGGGNGLSAELGLSGPARVNIGLLHQTSSFVDDGGGKNIDYAAAAGTELAMSCHSLSCVALHCIALLMLHFSILYIIVSLLIIFFLFVHYVYCS